MGLSKDFEVCETGTRQALTDKDMRILELERLLEAAMRRSGLTLDEVKATAKILEDAA